MYICKSSLNDCGLSYLVLLTMLPVPHNPTVKVCSSFDDKRMDFQTVLNTSFYYVSPDFVQTGTLLCSLLIRSTPCINVTTSLAG